MTDRGEHCQDCGAEYLTVYWLPNDVWLAITPEPDSEGGGLLCPPCADRRASEAGLSLYWTAALDSYDIEHRIVSDDPDDDFDPEEEE